MYAFEAIKTLLTLLAVRVRSSGWSCFASDDTEEYASQAETWTLVPLTNQHLHQEAQHVASQARVNSLCIDNRFETPRGRAPSMGTTHTWFELSRGSKHHQRIFRVSV